MILITKTIWFKNNINCQLKTKILKVIRNIIQFKEAQTLATKTKTINCKQKPIENLILKINKK